MSGRKIVPVIGLVGGVGSGKSSVATWVASRGKVAIVNGDEAGHRVLRTAGVKNQLRQQFGNSIFDEQGEVAGALAALVFGSSPAQRQARTQLEKIVHPAIRELLSQQIQEIRNSNSAHAVLMDAAVLFEAGWNDLCDAIVYVDAPLADRLRRVRESRGWNEQTLNDREASQLPLETKRLASTDVIDNRVSVAEAGTRLQQVIERIIQQHQ